MDNLEGCFGSLVTAAVAGKDDLRDLVKTNLALTKTVVSLTDTNMRLVKKVETWTNSVGGDGGSGSGSGSGGGNRHKGKWCNNCKRKTWHEEDKCFELRKSKRPYPSHWKLVLWWGGADEDCSARSKIIAQPIPSSSSPTPPNTLTRPITMQAQPRDNPPAIA